MSHFEGIFIMLVFYSVLTATLPTVLNDSFWIYYTTAATHSCLSDSIDCSCPPGYILNSSRNACRLVPTFTLQAAIEIIYVIGLGFMALSLLSLRRHIGLYREKMRERNVLISQIKVKNIDLRKELDTELSRIPQNFQQEGAFVSPISKVIKIIRDIQVKEELDDDTVADLDYVVHLLLSNQLFKPQLMNSNMESEVSQWLKQITGSDQKEEVHLAVKAAGRRITATNIDASSGFSKK